MKRTITELYLYYTPEHQIFNLAEHFLNHELITMVFRTLSVVKSQIIYETSQIRILTESGCI
jgi:hypothetical protein